MVFSITYGISSSHFEAILSFEMDLEEEVLKVNFDSIVLHFGLTDFSFKDGVIIDKSFTNTKKMVTFISDIIKKFSHG